MGIRSFRYPKHSCGGMVSSTEQLLRFMAQLDIKSAKNYCYYYMTQHALQEYTYRFTEKMVFDRPEDKSSLRKLWDKWT